MACFLPKNFFEKSLFPFFNNFFFTRIIFKMIKSHQILVSLLEGHLDINVDKKINEDKFDENEE